MVIALGWFLFGLAFFLLARAFRTLTTGAIGVSVFSLTASFLLSFIVPFVPGGIGVREGVMAYLLSPVLPASLSSLVAIAMRLVLVVCEGLAALVAWLASWLRARILLRGY